MTTYANRVTAKYVTLRAAREAGGSPINFLVCTVVLGDGGSAGEPPTLSAMLAVDGVTHEVWRGAVVVSCAPNDNDPTQIDIGIVIPAAVGGSEVGPFQINEVAILHPDGGCLVVAQMNAYKGDSTTGLPGDLALVVQIGASPDDVVITPPVSGIFATTADIKGAINAHQPDCAAPLTKTDTVAEGWLSRIFGLRAARQPSAVTGSVVLEADASGYGRPATDDEFAAGVATPGGYAFPWPTLAQIKAAIAGIVPYGVNAPLTKNDVAKKYGIANGTQAAVGALRIATSAEVVARTTNPTGGGPCAVRPEDIPAILADPWGTGLGAIVEVPGYVNFGAVAKDPVGLTTTGAKINSGGDLGAFFWNACFPPNTLPAGDMSGWADARQGSFTGNWKCIQFRQSFLHETGVEPSMTTNATATFRKVP